MHTTRMLIWWAVIGASYLIGCGAEAEDPRHFEPAEITRTLPKGTPGAANGQLDYCSSGAPCASGEGDCDRDSECVSGLVCGYDNLERFLAGACSGCDACVSSHCRDGVQNSDETGADCGGADCGSCLQCPVYPNGAADHCSSICRCGAGEGDCDADAQCAPGLVCGLGLGPQFAMPFGHDVCVAAHCTDDTQNFGETGVDCGGVDCGSCISCSTTIGASTCSPTCPCPSGLGDCDSDRECQSGLVCSTGISEKFGFGNAYQVCAAPHCSNGVLDATETGVDCGGPCGVCPTVPGLCNETGWVSDAIAPSGTLLELGTGLDNRVHVAFNAAGVAHVASRSATGWQTDNAPALVEATAAAFHPVTGKPYIAGYGPAVAFRQSGTWVIDSAASGPVGPWSYAYFYPQALTVSTTGSIRGIWEEISHPFYFFSAVSWSPGGAWSHDGVVSTRRTAPGGNLNLSIRIEAALGIAGTLHTAFSHPAAMVDGVALGCDGSDLELCWASPKALPGEYGAADIATDSAGTLLVAATGNAALDCSSWPHGADELKVTLLRRTGSQWSSEIVAPTGIFANPQKTVCSSYEVAPELVVAPSGEALICWLQPPSGGAAPNTSQPVRCAWKQGGAYHLADVVPGARRAQTSDQGSWGDIALGISPNGCCHVAYTHPATGTLMHASDCAAMP